MPLRLDEQHKVMMIVEDPCRAPNEHFVSLEPELLAYERVEDTMRVVTAIPWIRAIGIAWCDMVAYFIGKGPAGAEG